MKNRLFLLAIAAALLLSAGPALAEMKGEVNLFFGMKDVKDDYLGEIQLHPDFSPLDVTSMTEYGVGASFGGVDWPVMIAVDLFMGSDDDSSRGDYYDDYEYKAELDTTEIDLGVRKFWTGHEKFHPYVGGGLAWIDAEATLTLTYLPEDVEVFGDSGSDSAIGYWLGGGVMWRITPKLSLGLDLRYSDVNVDFDVEEDIEATRQVEEPPGDLDVGGMRYGLLFGFRW